MDALDTASLISPMLGVVAVIILAYFVTKWLATRNTFKPAAGKRIRVIERVPLTRDTWLALVSVCGRTYLISVGPGRAEKLCELTDDAAAPGDAEQATDEFDSLLSQRVDGFRRAAQDPRRAQDETSNELERRDSEQGMEERPRRVRR